MHHLVDRNDDAADYAMNRAGGGDELQLVDAGAGDVCRRGRRGRENEFAGRPVDGDAAVTGGEIEEQRSFPVTGLQNRRGAGDVDRLSPPQVISKDSVFPRKTCIVTSSPEAEKVTPDVVPDIAVAFLLGMGRVGRRRGPLHDVDGLQSRA